MGLILFLDVNFHHISYLLDVKNQMLLQCTPMGSIYIKMKKIALFATQSFSLTLLNRAVSLVEFQEVQTPKIS